MSPDLPQVLTNWNGEPSVLAGLALFVGAYLLVIGPLRSRFEFSEKVTYAKVTWFLLGALVILLALVSPLDELGDHYLFSAHMVQHLLLTLIAPPLLLMGTPGWALRPLLRHSTVARTARVLTVPFVAFALFNAVFLTWHIPGLYEATLHNEIIHIIEHLCFIVTGVLNWWPILSPLPELPRLSYPSQVLYLFLDTLPLTVLGALIVFAPTVIYPTYAAAPRMFGISVMADQQISGLILWVPGGLIYLIALTIIFFVWLGQEEYAEQHQLI